jgi:Transposase, Mutator family
MPGRQFVDIADFHAQLAEWTATVADARVHGTTHEQPMARFEREKPHLMPWSRQPGFKLAAPVSRIMPDDWLIHFQSNRYSVPFRLVGQTDVLNYLPKSVQPKAKSALHQIWMAETKAKAQAAFERFVAGFKAKYPKAVDCLVKDREALLAFYDFPAEHWAHIRSTNVIESAFATIRHRSERAKGCVSRDSMLSMIFKLGMSAQLGWRRLKGFEFLAKVIAGVKFRDGLEPPLDVKVASRKPEREHSRVAA